MLKQLYNCAIRIDLLHGNEPPNTGYALAIAPSNLGQISNSKIQIAIPEYR